MARTPKVVEDRREQIIDAALQVFSQKGFERTTNKDIADEAGITPGLIYHYFKSKEDLLKAAIEDHSPVGFVHSLPEQLFEQPPEQFLHFMAQKILEITEGEPFVRLLRVFLPEVIYNPSITSFNLGAIQEVSEFLVRYLEAKMDSGELRRSDASLTLQVFTGSLFAFVIRRQILHDPLSLQYTHEEIVESVVSTLLDGLRSS
ncbi:MAG: TetR/AcrR family transcriptional regulator [Chloroflexota bacterium]